MRARFTLTLTVAAIIGIAMGAAMPRFVEADPASGLRFQYHNSPTSRKYLIETMGGGVAIFDYDNDGWPDVFFVNGASLHDPQPNDQSLDKSSPEFWNRLFHNNRDGTFTDVTEASGLKGRGYGMGVATGDYDNDGFTDLLVTNYGGALLYHNNGNGTFTDVTSQAGIRTSGWTTGSGLFDYNRDGCADLFVARYLDWDFDKGGIFCGVSSPGGRAYCHPDEFRPVASYLFRNNCNGTFTDVSAASGIASGSGKGLGVAFGDFNGDGWPDIYVANDSAPQMLFRNNGDGTFTDVALTAGVAYTEDGKTFSGMGATFADLNNRGRPDILATALPYEDYALFRNVGKGQFNYASVSSGLGLATRPFGGWGICAFDYDNDGNKEIFLANAHVMDNIEITQPHLRSLEPPQLLRYAGAKFSDISAAAGDVFKSAWAARGAAFGDLDNDGDIDVVVTDLHGPAHLLRNKGGNRNHWIGLDLRGTKSNRDALGAQVRLTSAEGKVQYASVFTAGSYLSASDRRVYFGLGQEQTIRDIQVNWPSGIEQHLAGQRPDQILKIVEPTQAAAQTSVSSSIPELKTEAQRRLDMGFALAKQSRSTDAIAAFRDAIRLNPDLMEAHFSLGVLLARQGQANYSEAMRHFLEVLRLNPRDVDALINVSNLLEAEGDFTESVATMKKAVGFAQDKTELFVMLGEKQEKASQYLDAVESFRDALKSGRPLPRAHLGLGVALRHLRNLDDAVKELETALRLIPEDPVAHFELGAIASEQRRFADAAAQLLEAARLQPGMVEAYLHLGRVYQRLGQSAESRAAYRKAIELRPEQISALYTHARNPEDPHESAELFAKIRELKARSLQSEEADDSNSEGLRLMKKDHYDEALAAFRRALYKNPSLAVAAYNMGVVLARKGHMPEAAEAFRSAIRSKPGLAVAHLGLGLVLLAQGDPGADEELRNARMLDNLAGKSNAPTGQ